MPSRQRYTDNSNLQRSRQHGCQGVTNDWEKCAAAGSTFCGKHEAQRRFYYANIPVQDYKAHILDNRCCGLIKDNSRLCCNRVAADPGPIRYCWRHGDQRPHSWNLPATLDKLKICQGSQSSVHEELLHKLLAIARLVSKQAPPNRSAPKSKTEQESYKGSSGFYAKEQWQPPPPKHDYTFFNDFYAHYTDSRAHSGRSAGDQQQSSTGSKESSGHYKRDESNGPKEENKQEDGRKQKEEPTPRRTTDGHRTRWSEAQALHEYKRKASAFEEIKCFSKSNPPSFSIVPWPVLLQSSTIRPEDITWVAVENFFAAIRSPLEKRTLLSQAQKMFHPDRNTGRGMFKYTVPEQAVQLQNCLKIVSQVVNSLCVS